MAEQQGTRDAPQGWIPSLNAGSASQKAPFMTFNRGRRQSCKRTVDVTRVADKDIARVPDNNRILQRLGKKVQRIFQRSGRRKATIRTIGIEEGVNGTETTLVITALTTEPCAYQGYLENDSTVLSSDLTNNSYFSAPSVAILAHEPLSGPTSESTLWDEKTGYSGYGHDGGAHTEDLNEGSDDSSGITTTATVLIRAMPVSRELSVVHSNIACDAQLSATISSSRSAESGSSCLNSHSIMESDEDRSPLQNSSYSSSDMISSVSVNGVTFSPSFSDSDNMEQGRPRVTAGHPFVQSSEETTQSDLSSSGSENTSSIYNGDDDGDRNDACRKKEVHHRNDDSVRNQSINDPEDWADHFLSIQNTYWNHLVSLHHELCKDLHQRLEQHQRQILDLQRDMTCGLNGLSPRAVATVRHSIDPRMDQDRKMQRKYCWLMERAIMTSLEGSMFNASFTEDTVDGMRHCEDVEDDAVANGKSSTATQAAPDEKWELFARSEPERPHATILDLHNAQRQEKHIGLSFLNDGTCSRHSSDVKEKHDERASSGSDSTVDSCMREEIMKRVAELDAEAINNADRNEEEKAYRPQEGRRRSACPSRQHNSSPVSASRPASPVGFGLQSQSPPSSPRWFFHRNSLDIPVSNSRTTPCRCAATATKSNGAHKPRLDTRPTRSQTAIFTPAKSAAKTLPSAVYDSGATVINNYFRGGVHYHRQPGHRPTPSRICLREVKAPLRSMSAISSRQYERCGCSKYSAQDASESSPWAPSFRCSLHHKPRSSQTSHDSCIQGNVQKEIKLLDEDEETGTGYEAGSDSYPKPYTEPNKKATLSKSRDDIDSGAGVGNIDVDLSYSWGIGDPNSREGTSLDDPVAPQQQHIFPFRLKEEQAGSTIPIVDQSSWIRASHINETMLTLEGRFEEAEEVQETRKIFESSINPTGSEKKRVSGNPTGLMQKHLEGKFEFDQWVALHDIRSQNVYLNKYIRQIGVHRRKTWKP